MQHISKMVNTKDGKETALQNSSSDHQTQKYEPSDRIIKFWARMTVRYGPLWTRRWADSRMLKLGQAEWQSELEPFTNDQIRQALKGFKGEFPPSLPSLVDACRALVPKPNYRVLPKPSGNKSVALDEIAKMRRTLKGTSE